MHQIVATNIATGESTQLTDGKLDYLNPQISPDGNTIVFCGGDGDTNYSVYIYDIGTGMISPIQNGETLGYDNEDPTFTPDGKRIVFKSTNSQGFGDIWVMNKDGTNSRNITNVQNGLEAWKPAVLNDGTLIYTIRAVHGDPNSDKIYAIFPNTNTPICLTPDNVVSHWYPSVIPARDAIAYVSNRSDQSDGMYVLNIPSRDTTQILLKLSGDNDDPYVFQYADKTYGLLFVNDANGNYECYAIQLDEQFQPIGDPHLVYASSGSDVLGPTYSPRHISRRTTS